MSAIVYLGRPKCLFDLALEIFLGTCNKKQESDTESQGLDEDKVTPAIALIFNTDQDISLLATTDIGGDLALFDLCELSLVKVVELGAQTLALSPHGLTFVTGDSVGNIQLFEFESLRLMYRIRAGLYQIKGITFPYDSLDFCDVRGLECNVWEPSVLA